MRSAEYPLATTVEMTKPINRKVNKYLPGLRRCRRRDWCALVNSILGIRLSLRTHSRSGHKSTKRKGADSFQIVSNGPNTRPTSGKISLTSLRS
ncbi:hypothetical protein SUGI_1060740 [Cryptomeria japonica]|nr:hypothetical protein SUGI_1060740 [Cryptomeria japonica]